MAVVHGPTGRSLLWEARGAAASKVTTTMSTGRNKYVCEQHLQLCRKEPPYWGRSLLLPGVWPARPRATAPACLRSRCDPGLKVTKPLLGAGCVVCVEFMCWGPLQMLKVRQGGGCTAHGSASPAARERAQSRRVSCRAPCPPLPHPSASPAPALLPPQSHCPPASDHATPQSAGGGAATPGAAPVVYVSVNSLGPGCGSPRLWILG